MRKGSVNTELAHKGTVRGRQCVTQYMYIGAMNAEICKHAHIIDHILPLAAQNMSLKNCGLTVTLKCFVGGGHCVAD